MTALPPWAETLVTVSALLLALGTIYRYVLPALRGLWRGVKALVHASEEVRDVLEDFRTVGGFQGLADQVNEVKALATASQKELHPNGGGSLRDAVDEGRTEARAAATAARAAVEEAQRIGHITESLQGGIADLRTETSTHGQRITDHRRRNDEAIAALREYLQADRDDLLLAKQGLEAAVTELLMVESHETRKHIHPLPDGPPNTGEPIVQEGGEQ